MTISFHPYIYDAGAEHYRIVETANETFELSNANASDLLAVLGFVDLWSAPPQPILGFLDRLTAALRKSIDQPSAEIPTTIDRAPGQMTVVDCGRAEGYLNRRLHELSTLVRQGKDPEPPMSAGDDRRRSGLASPPPSTISWSMIGFSP